MMRIEAALQAPGQGESSKICERTARRWFLKIGWKWGRNKKGYCDGHEREDVVQYQEKVFCPRMKASTNVHIYL